MSNDLNNKLVIAISSRALFDLTDSHAVFERDGIAAYAKYQREKENDILAPGHAFPLAQKLLKLKHPKTNERLVEIVLLSRNNANTGLRIFNSIQEHKLAITRAAFTQGESPYQYVAAFNAHLFLSAESNDVIAALNAGCAAATMIASESQHHGDQIRIAFDGDAVLFSDEAERIFQAHGLDAFAENEVKSADKPLADGPLKGFLQALHHAQKAFAAEECPIRTALVTARSAPAHTRVIKTLRAWNIRIDEALFLGGLEKGEFLKAFGADFFFDDQPTHCHQAKTHVATAHVPHGVINESL